ncbi:hypothetical protein NRK67_13635 [Fusobacteria bacterium ZRK30]|nr:hypothetical protein NRK67_13635 [Fusobacteria bacterium ZRK30]
MTIINLINVECKHIKIKSKIRFNDKFNLTSMEFKSKTSDSARYRQIINLTNME